MSDADPVSHLLPADKLRRRNLSAKGSQVEILAATKQLPINHAKLTSESYSTHFVTFSRTQKVHT